MSEHYETHEHLPDNLIEAIVKSKNVNQGLFNLRQLFFGIFDSE
jgi:Zn-dependent oligopeptidase